MKIIDYLKEPEGGWKYFDADLKTWVSAKSFEGLVQNVIELRSNKALAVPDHLRQLVEDQVCDRAGSGFCRPGLGDAVHAVAQPIARVLDKALGTNIKGCSACAGRRAKLNS